MNGDDEGEAAMGGVEPEKMIDNGVISPVEILSNLSTDNNNNNNNY